MLQTFSTGSVKTLPQQREMAAYVEHRIDAFIKKHEKEIKEEYKFGKEYTEEEYEEKLQEFYVESTRELTDTEYNETINKEIEAIESKREFTDAQYKEMVHKLEELTESKRELTNTEHKEMLDKLQKSVEEEEGYGEEADAEYQERLHKLNASSNASKREYIYAKYKEIFHKLEELIDSPREYIYDETIEPKREGIYEEYRIMKFMLVRLKNLVEEFTDAEYIKMIDNLIKFIELKTIRESAIIGREAYKEDYKKQWQKSHKEEWEDKMKCLEYDMKKTQQFQEDLKALKCKLENYPKSMDDAIKQLQDFVIEQCNDNYQDLLDGFFTTFAKTVEVNSPKDKDYTKTIKSVFDSKCSKKVLKKIESYFKEIQEMLISNTLKLKAVSECGEYTKIFELLKKEFWALIMNGLREEIERIIQVGINKAFGKCYNIRSMMTDSTTVKKYSEHFLTELNQFLIKALPEKITEFIRDKIIDSEKRIAFRFQKEIGFDFALMNDADKAPAKAPIIKESQGEEFDVQVIPDKAPIIEEPDSDNEESKIMPKKTMTMAGQTTMSMAGEKTLESFIQTIPSGWIEVNKLTQMYNEYFGKEISTIGFGKLKDIHTYFEVNKNVEQGKKITYYRPK